MGEKKIHKQTNKNQNPNSNQRHPQKTMAAAESDTNQNVQSEVLGTDDSGTVKINCVFNCKLKRQNTFSVYLQRKPLPSS